MSPFAGTGVLLRLMVHRERVRLGIWVVVLGMLMAWLPFVFKGLFPTQEPLENFVRLYALNPVMRLFGLASGADLGAFLMTRGHLMFTIAIVLMSVFAVVRNTRKDEDEGRTELVGSTSVGRNAETAAAVILVGAVNLLLGIVFSVSLMLHGFAVPGSFAAGAAVAGLGICFTAVAALAAQVGSTGRSANALAMATFGAAYLLAGVGNLLGRPTQGDLVLQSAWPAWLSPVGWSQQIRPFGGDHFWVLVPMAAFSAATVAAALWLRHRRDVGQGLLQPRRGPAGAARSLLSPAGLAWRQQRSAFIGWAVGIAALSLVFGATSIEVEGILDDLGEFTEVFFGGTEQILQGYLAVILQLVGILAAAYTVQTLLRMRSEEAHGTLEATLATAVGRGHWMAGHVANALAGAFLLVVLGGLVTGLVSGILLGDVLHWTATLIVAGLVQIPAVYLLGALVALLFAILPRFCIAGSWSLLGVTLLVGPLFGPLLDLPLAVQDLSPFSHTPDYPAQAVTAWPPAILLAAAAAVAAAAVLAFRRRDLDL